MTTPALPDWAAPLLLPDELAASDAHAARAGTPTTELMERAGRQLAAAALRHLPPGPIAVLCGPGNNGGDGYVAARRLAEAGRRVHLASTRDPDELEGDAAWAYANRGGSAASFGVGVDSARAALEAATGVVECLLGTGAGGAPRGDVGAFVQLLAEYGHPVVACDIPTGVDAADGSVAGDAVQAAATVTFHRPSPGHVVRPGKAHCGVLEIADIGIPPGAPVTPSYGAIRDRVIRELPARGGDAHKYAAGAVVVLAGSARYPGAAILSVLGAQRGGAGYVTAIVEEGGADVLRSAAPEAIVMPRPSASELRGMIADGHADAVVVGPGLATDDTRALVEAALAAGRPTVLDADGLAPYGGRPEELRRDAPLVLTPHAGELGRLLDRPSDEISAARLASAREAAERAQAILVLKGDDTIVAAPDGRALVNDLSAPGLATAGTGDVLAGLIGALLASGADPLLAAAAGVRLHARAGRIAAGRAGADDGIVAGDVAAALPAARGGRS